MAPQRCSRPDPHLWAWPLAGKVIWRSGINSGSCDRKWSWVTPGLLGRPCGLWGAGPGSLQDLRGGTQRGMGRGCGRRPGARSVGPCGRADTKRDQSASAGASGKVRPSHAGSAQREPFQGLSPAAVREGIRVVSAAMPMVLCPGGCGTEPSSLSHSSDARLSPAALLAEPGLWMGGGQGRAGGGGGAPGCASHAGLGPAHSGGPSLPFPLSGSVPPQALPGGPLDCGGPRAASPWGSPTGASSRGSGRQPPCWDRAPSRGSHA